MPQIIFPLIFFAEFLSTPKILLFYDQIEYLRIVSSHSFFEVFSLGHFPIHPLFMGIFWITSKLLLPNSTALVFGIASALLMYKISKLIFKNGNFWLPSIVFLLFPGVWLINTNLMVHSVLLTFYLISIYFFLQRKALPFIISIFLMVGIHIDALYWIPTIFLFPFIFREEIVFNRKEIIRFVKLALLGIFLSFFLYAFIYFFIRRDFGGSTEQLFAYSSFGLLRMIRNIWFSFIKSFGGLTPFVFVFLALKKVKSRVVWISWIIFFSMISIGGAYWEGDLMMRRIVFAGAILALAFYKYLKEKSLWLILYLLPIIIASGVLYFRDSPNMPIVLMQKRESELPQGEVLIQSHYYMPFTKYDGKILWVGVDNFDQIDSYLASGKRVFLEKDAVTAPYRLFVGNNYHITSLGKIGDSESKFLFKKYKVSLHDSALELKLVKQNEIAASAGEPVIFYNQGFWGRLARRRIDYGDIGTWIWALVANHWDPSGWTYRDATGVWACPGAYCGVLK